jgi:hypothetical protein
MHMIHRRIGLRYRQARKTYSIAHRLRLLSYSKTRISPNYFRCTSTSQIKYYADMQTSLSQSRNGVR